MSSGKLSFISAALVAVVLAALSLAGRHFVSAGSAGSGDANCDGRVNSIDASVVLQYSAGLLHTIDCPDNADANGDGHINSLDAAIILQFDAGLLDHLGLSATATRTPMPPSSTVPPTHTTPTDTPAETSTPTATFTATETAMPTETPIPTHTGKCSPWPPEIETILDRLPVVDGVCLVLFADQSEVPQGTTCPTACYLVNLREVWCVGDCSAPVGGELSALAHEVCHAHQHQVILDAGLGEPDNFVDDWLNTPEGRSFIELGAWRLEDGVLVEVAEEGWSGYPNPLEDSANTCAVWYYNPIGEHGEGGPAYLQRYAPIRYQWVAQWLPP